MCSMQFILKHILNTKHHLFICILDESLFYIHYYSIITYALSFHFIMAFCLFMLDQMQTYIIYVCIIYIQNLTVFSHAANALKRKHRDTMRYMCTQQHV